MKNPLFLLASLVVLFCAFHFSGWAQSTPTQQPTDPHTFLGYTDSYAKLQPPGTRTHCLASTDRHDTGNEDGFANLSANPTAGSIFIDESKNQVVLGEIKTGPLGHVYLNHIWKTFMEIISKVPNTPLPEYNLIIESPTETLHTGQVTDYFNGTLFPSIFSFDQFKTAAGFNLFKRIDAKNMRVAVDHKVLKDNELVLNEQSKHFFGLKFTACSNQTSRDYLPTLDDLEKVFKKSIRGRWPHKTEAKWKSFSARLQPGVSTLISSYQNEGVILGLRFHVSDEQDWNDLWICIEADGKERVKIPLGFFSGVGQVAYDVRAGFFGLTKDKLESWNYFPQPYMNDYKLSIENRSTDSTVKLIKVEVSKHNFSYPKPWGYFTAIFEEGLSVLGEYYKKGKLESVYGKIVGEVLDTKVKGFFAADGTLLLGTIADEIHLEGDPIFFLDDQDASATDGTESDYGQAFYLHPVFDVPQLKPTTPEFPNNFPIGRFSNANLGHSGALVCFTAGVFQGFPGAFVERFRSYYHCRLAREKYFFNSFEAKGEHGTHNTTSGVLNRVATFVYINETPLMTKVDEIELTDLDSETAHNYVVDEDFQNISLTTRYWYRDNVISDQGYAIPLGEQSSFTITVPADNNGIRLSARSDGQTPAPVTAKVFVDGIEAGIFHRSETSEGGCFANFGSLGEDIPRWKTMSAEIPFEFTKGKSVIQITVVPETEGWNEYRWEIFSYK